MVCHVPVCFWMLLESFSPFAPPPPSLFLSFRPCAMCIILGRERGDFRAEAAGSKNAAAAGAAGGTGGSECLFWACANFCGRPELKLRNEQLHEKRDSLPGVPKSGPLRPYQQCGGSRLRFGSLFAADVNSTPATALLRRWFIS